MATTENIAEIKYNFIHDFINLNDADIINKVVLYMHSIMPSDTHSNNIDTLRSLCGSISEDDACKMQAAISEASQYRLVNQKQINTLWNIC